MSVREAGWTEVERALDGAAAFRMHPGDNLMSSSNSSKFQREKMELWQHLTFLRAYFVLGVCSGDCMGHLMVEASEQLRGVGLLVAPFYSRETEAYRG